MMGDHGMTTDGNHGGGSEQEVTSALFVYFPANVKTTRHSTQCAFSPVPQVDFVPTMSLMLGLPIPYLTC